MRFIQPNEIAEWCRDHGMAVSDHGFTLLPDPRLSQESRVLYAPNGPSGLEAEVLDVCVAKLGIWAECLFWPVAWDIWESSEDWPRFYAERGARGERRSLASTPGHLFTSAEIADLRLFLAIALAAGWDAHLLPVAGCRADRRFWNSHDGWISMHAEGAECLPDRHSEPPTA